MRLCEGRVAIITGAGRGVGRAYALMLTQHGAKIVVNDLGAAADGRGGDAAPGAEVVAAIAAAGGAAVLNTADVTDTQTVQAMVQQAITAFGRLDILVNNAGILRDRLLTNTSEDDWDTVVRVHLKGTFLPMHHAGNYWRLQTKAGIAGMSIVAARELQRIGATVNAIAPRANTRLTEGLAQWTAEQMERRDPIWTAALVTWLASAESKGISGRVFESWGYGYTVAEGWQHGAMTAASKDPATLGPAIRDIVARSRKNAGVDRDTWMDP